MVVTICCRLLQPIHKWTSSNVVEWMASINLINPVEIFKSMNIDGSELLNLDKEKLTVSDARARPAVFCLKCAADSGDLVLGYIRVTGLK